MAESNISMVEMDDGVKIYVKMLGEEPSTTKTKPLLINLHSAPGASNHAESEAAFGHLSDIFRVLVFDARGSGASDLVGPFTHDRWVRDIESLRKWACAEKFVLTGASYGGFLALDYAVQHGDRLLGLILRDTWANGLFGTMNGLANILRSKKINVNVERQVRLWSGTLLDDQDFEDSLVEILPFFAPPENVKPVPTLSESTRSSTEPSKFHSATQNEAFGFNVPRFDVREKLKNIKAPTLVIVGRYDYLTPVASSEEIASGIPFAKLEIFEWSGHSPPSDEPEKFKQILSDFLESRILPYISGRM